MIRHNESGKTYIGRSVNIETRWSQHKSDAKKGRTNKPVHNALRKYGESAFTWKVLTTAPVRIQPVLEKQFILEWGTLSPAGYNVGGTVGGFPSRDLIAAMSPEEQARWAEVHARVAKLGIESLRKMRSDPAYEVEYIRVRRVAAFKREAKVKAKRASDPEYDAKCRATRQESARKNPNKSCQVISADTLRKRMLEDGEFNKKVRENRRKSALTRHENFRARVRVTTDLLRKGLKDADLA